MKAVRNTLVSTGCYQKSCIDLCKDIIKNFTKLSGTKVEETSEEKSVVFGHGNHFALKFSVNAKEQEDKIPTMY